MGPRLEDRYRIEMPRPRHYGVDFGTFTDGSGPSSYKRLDPTTERLLDLQDQASSNRVRNEVLERKNYQVKDELDEAKDKLEAANERLGRVTEDKKYWSDSYFRVDNELDKYKTKERRAKEAAKKAKAKKGKK